MKKIFKIGGDVVVSAKWSNYGRLKPTKVYLKTKKLGQHKLIPARVEILTMKKGLRVDGIANPKQGIVILKLNKAK